MGPLVHEIDDFDLPGFTTVAAGFGLRRFGFVVTPNVDHLIRYHDDAGFRECYRAASYILMDSRFASRLVRLTKGLRLRICTGSDLTAALFERVIGHSDRVLLIGGSTEQSQAITHRFGLTDLHHHNPPMGFIHDAAATERCLDFIENLSPFRFCFLAVGSPQQERLALALRQRGRARGLALCVGASLNFITGSERRAPRWMQQMGIEWLYRLLQNPRRLARRYLVRGPRFFAQILRARFVLRSRDRGEECQN
ncbi:MAG TPA: WecB/TagA/CpsF family glycosyltransferase [Steroidobacteraceae bacterium]|nr:WecB/TagA/CpsF family glycosyltransferase [Steroidobacteraceae bacterium]